MFPFLPLDPCFDLTATPMASMPASPLRAMDTTGSTDSKIIAQCKQLKEINPKLSCVSARAVRGNYSNKLRRLDLTINLVPARPRADICAPFHPTLWADHVLGYQHRVGLQGRRAAGLLRRPVKQTP